MEYISNKKRIIIRVKTKRFWIDTSPRLISWLWSRSTNLIHIDRLSSVLIAKNTKRWFHVQIPEEHDWGFVHFCSLELN